MSELGMTSYRVARITGDGIGPEIVAAALVVLDAAAARFGFGIEWTDVLAGGVAIDAYGTAIRDEDLDVLLASDAVLLGAVGGPRWDDPAATVRPEQGLLRIRKVLGLYANLRPVTVEPSLKDASPLRRDLIEGVDLMIVRELTGGIYFGDRREAHPGPDGRQAYDTESYSELEVRRIVRLAFELARGRRRHLTSVDKANVLASSRLWRTVVEEVAPEYPDVELEHRLVDSTAMSLITKPASFDVIVTSNMFGDILSDEASVLAGSLGMLPSASLGERTTQHGTTGMYEPSHGSSPAKTGLDIANPTATILSAAMMLRWSLGQAAAADAIEAA
ncbi:MAG TPA: 3-isopropylmalate dehydrogenase, partial [Candidatus Limnocylindrales bacterium]|nr:3-isopropylmalate dehydrogenase [Candidatus Limnocylindrales bacterium]